MFWLIFAIALWGAVHSVLASTRIKKLFRRTSGNGFRKMYRLLYNLFAAISFLPILYLMVKLPNRILYQISVPFNYLMYAGQIVSLFLLVAAALQTDLVSFVGLRQLFEAEKTGMLITKGLYKFVRHPLYAFSLLILWLSPTMSLNFFVAYLGLTLYILLGIIFEERKLVREFGREYEEYRSVTPMLVPRMNFIWNKSHNKSV